ncbi:baseplate J/gp47 family protein [Lysinibacillus mangiferihumi]|uniref:Baseplate J/gp47 family protein n=1 Tax=Lysinibacillus mangiferihumi TaxID=1130819 RepID=A0A4U2YXK7_9BACI|nr:baseplate J/gp47 family protein [Lysinibacillus mangiferihumi]TKI65552.1 baseplate J/gp47 family protein [Lysinibacillus mangiferihumi]
MTLDKTGFKRKTYSELVDSMSAKAKEKFGADANTTERSVLGIIIRIMAWFFSLLWQDTEDVYHSAYRKTAEGNQLDMLLPYAGITRNLADFSYGQIEVIGTPNHFIESGFLVSTENDIYFETMYDLTLNEEGKGFVDIVAYEIGARGNVGANTITQIVNPDADIIRVNNLLKTNGGREKETDAEARERADITVEGIGSATTAAIRTNLLKISSIRAAKVIENYKDEVDQYGTPPRSIQAFVLGGSDEEIAKAIHEKKAGGIQPYGTTYFDVLDLSGEVKQIGFTRANEVNVYIKVNVTTNTSFTSNGVNQIKTALIKYVGGTDVNNNTYAGLNMGDDVVVSRLIAKTYSVDGIEDVIVEVSKDGINYNDSNVVIGLQEVAQTHFNDIEVTVNV